MNDANIVNGPKPAAVIDTNVVLDFLSIHNAYDAVKGNDNAERDMRWRRTGEALRLAIHLDDIGFATTGYDAEAKRILLVQADPNKPSFKREYVRLFVTFVWELLPAWRHAELRITGDPTANKADHKLVEIAGQLDVPLVTQEMSPKKAIRKRASELGVRVQTPTEFCANGPSKVAIERFIERFATQAPSFRRGEADYEFTQKVLGKIYHYYVDVLEETAPAAHRRTA